MVLGPLLVHSLSAFTLAASAVASTLTRESSSSSLAPVVRRAPAGGVAGESSLVHRAAAAEEEAQKSSLTMNSVAMIHMSSLKGNVYKNRAVSGFQTWGADLKHLYYVMEGSREDFTNTFAATATDCTWRQYGSYPVVQCQGEPQVVMMSECDGAYWGACGKGGPCCKFDHALKFLRSTPFYNELQWMVFSDDDVYWRKDSLLALLNERDSGSAAAVVFDSAGTGRMIPGNFSQMCANKMTSGWFQPTAITKAAMDRLLPAADAAGLTQECKLFQLTHDTALAVLFWMYDIDLVVRGEEDQLTVKKQIDVRGVRYQCNLGPGVHDPEYFHSLTNFSRTVLYHPVKKSRCMQNLHDYVQKSVSFTGPFDFHTMSQCNSKYAQCYRDTKHAARFDIVRKFEAFKPQDCQEAPAADDSDSNSLLEPRRLSRKELDMGLRQGIFQKSRWIWDCEKETRLEKQGYILGDNISG
jgi:hypothetical protein